MSWTPSARRGTSGALVTGRDDAVASSRPVGSRARRSCGAATSLLLGDVGLLVGRGFRRAREMSWLMIASCCETATASLPSEPTLAPTAASIGAATLALAATAPLIGAATSAFASTLTSTLSRSPSSMLPAVAPPTAPPIGRWRRRLHPSRRRPRRWRRRPRRWRRRLHPWRRRPHPRQCRRPRRRWRGRPGCRPSRQGPRWPRSDRPRRCRSPGPGRCPGWSAPWRQRPAPGGSARPGR